MRVEGIFQKNSETLSNFFEVDKIDFPSSPKALKRPCFYQRYCIAKKQANKNVIGPFLENFAQKFRFFGARFSLKIF